MISDLYDDRTHELAWDLNDYSEGVYWGRAELWLARSTEEILDYEIGPVLHVERPIVLQEGPSRKKAFALLAVAVLYAAAGLEDPVNGVLYRAEDPELMNLVDAEFEGFGLEQVRIGAIRYYFIPMADIRAAIALLI